MNRIINPMMKRITSCGFFLAARGLTLPLVLAILATAAQSVALAQTFTGLGHAPGATYSYGFGVSGDGLVAVGWSDHAFRWTAAGGIQDLGTMGGIVSSALGTSDDGQFVTGNGDLAPPAPFYNAFRWSSAEGMVSLGTLGAASYGTAISSDGAVVVGHSIIRPSGFDRPFRWTAASGMQDLGVLSGDLTARAQGVSADGSVVVGYSGSRAFRWTIATGMADLGFMPGGNDSYAFAVSRNGSVVAGRGTTAQGDSVAFRWTAEEGMVPLGKLPTGSGSFANAIGGDGATVVGQSDAAGFPRAFLWTAGTGMVDLNTYLPTLGLNLAGWTLTTANGVSTDGLTIVGTGTHNGNTEAWIATLKLTPPPAVLRCTAINFTTRVTGTTVNINGRVTVKDGNGIAMSSATVSATWTKPDGSTLAQTAMTSPTGIAGFRATGTRGTYTLMVTNIAKTGYTFDSARSILTKSITK